MIRLSETENQYIGKRIQNKRKALGLSQEQLAEMVDCSAVHMSRIECSGHVGSDLLMRLARALGISMDEIVGNFPIRSALTDKVLLMMMSRTEREQRILLQIIESSCELMDRFKDPSDQFWK